MNKFSNIIVTQRSSKDSVSPSDCGESKQQQQPQQQQQQNHRQSNQNHQIKPVPNQNIKQNQHQHRHNNNNNKYKNNAYQVTGKKRNPNSIINNCNNNIVINNNSNNNSNKLLNNNSSNNINNNNKTNNVISAQSTYTNSTNFNQKKLLIDTKSTSVESINSSNSSIDSISNSSGENSNTSAMVNLTGAMNLHLTSCITFDTRMHTDHKDQNSKQMIKTDAVSLNSNEFNSDTKQTYSVDFLHNVGAQMTIFGPSGLMPADNAATLLNRIRPQRNEYLMYNGSAGNNTTQNSRHNSTNNNNSDKDNKNNSSEHYRYQNSSSSSNSSNSNGGTGGKNQSQKGNVANSVNNNASVSPPLSIISNGSSTHSGNSRGTSSSNGMNGLNNYRSTGQQQTHQSNYQPFYFHNNSFFQPNYQQSHHQNQHHQQQTQNNNHQTQQNHYHQYQQQQQQSPAYASNYNGANNNNNSHHHNQNRNYQNGNGNGNKKNWNANFQKYRKNGSNQGNSNGNVFVYGQNSNKNNKNAYTNGFIRLPSNENSEEQGSSNQQQRNKTHAKNKESLENGTVSPKTVKPATEISNDLKEAVDQLRAPQTKATMVSKSQSGLLPIPIVRKDSSLSLKSSVDSEPKTPSPKILMPQKTLKLPQPPIMSVSSPISLSPSSVMSSTLNFDNMLNTKFMINSLNSTSNTTNSFRSPSTDKDSSTSSNYQQDKSTRNDNEPVFAPFQFNYPPPVQPINSNGTIFTEDMFLRLNGVITPTTPTNTSASAGTIESGQLSMPYYNSHQGVYLYDPQLYQNYQMQDVYTSPNTSVSSVSTKLQTSSNNEAPQQKRSYSGNSSPTQGNKTYRNNGTHRERNQNNSIRKTNYLSEPSDRFLTRAHLVELNTPPDSLCNGSKWDQLSQSIWQKFSSRQQTEDTYRKKTYLWKYLNSNIKKGFNRYSLYLVGSTISGFGLDSSDVDMCLVSRCVTPLDPRSEAMMHLSLLKNHLQNTSVIFDQFNLIQAKVPILRFNDTLHKLEIDLNYNNCVGIRNTHLLHCYAQMDWRLRPLALIVKIWAQFHYINNAKDMTISSYSLILMVIHFLQYAVQPPVLPCLHDMYPEKFQKINDITSIDMTEDLPPYNSENKQPLGELFLEFLEYYSTFNYEEHAISVRTAGVLPIEECRIVRTYKNEAHAWTQLCIEEPFDLTNTARSCYDEKIFERIKSVFVNSWHVLRDTMDLNKLFEEPFLSPPQNVVFDNLPLAQSFPLLPPMS